MSDLKHRNDYIKFLSDENKKLEQENAKLRARVERLQKCHMVLEHAVELGYLGEGSTAGMARDALKDCEDENDNK